MLTIQSTINIAGQTVPQIIPVVQGDTGRSILFTLADFTIPQGSTATYYVQKPSGEAVYNAATIDGNTVLVELTAQSIIEHGDNYGQVRIENDGEVVTSFDFILLVKPFRGIDATQSTTEMTIFDKAVEQAEEAIDDAKDAALDEINQTTGNFAEAFSASKAYSAGEYVMQSGHLYRFTSNHAAGAWSGSDAEAVTVGEELTDLKADTSTLKEDLDTIYEETGATYKIIRSALINSSGQIEAHSNWDVWCFDLSQRKLGIESIVSGGSSGTIYAFYSEEPSIGSVSVTESRTVLADDTLNGLVVPSGCNWLAVRCKKGYYIEISPKFPILEQIESDIDLLNTDVSDIENDNGALYKIIKSAYIAANGSIGISGDYDVWCFSLSDRYPRIEALISGGDNTGSVYAFYTSEPSIGSVSYNESRTTNASTSITDEAIPSGCAWLAVRCKKGSKITVLPKLPVMDKISNVCRYSAYYNDGGQSNFASDIVKCAVSYLVHQINNTQTTGTPNTEKQRFYAAYSSVSWRYLNRYDTAFVFQRKDKAMYNGLEYPVYYSHCTPFYTAASSLVAYEDSPWEYLFTHDDTLNLEHLWLLSQEQGDNYLKPYSFSYPGGEDAGFEIAFLQVKTGHGLQEVAQKSGSVWAFNEWEYNRLKTGDWLHISRSNVPRFMGVNHSMLFVKTIDEIAAAVESYGCSLDNWYGKGQYNGEYGYVIECTSSSTEGSDYIRISDLQAALARSNYNVKLYVSHARSDTYNSTIALRSNSIGELYFIHQPYTAACINGEPLELNVLVSKNYVAYQWQYSDDGTTWLNISGATNSQYVTDSQQANRQYRCRVTDLLTNHAIYSDPVTCYILTVSDPGEVPTTGTYTSSISVGGTSAAGSSGRWERADALTDSFVLAEEASGNTLSIPVASYSGKRYRYRVIFPNNRYYCTKSVLIP